MRVIMLTSGAVLLMTCAAFFIYELITFRDLMRRQLTTQSEIVADNSTAALAFDDKEAAAETLKALDADKHIMVAALFDLEGKLFATYHTGRGDVPARLQADGYRFTQKYLEVYQPVLVEGKRLGTLFIRSDLEAIYDRFRLYGGIAVLFMLVSFLFAYLLSKLLQKSISTPLLELAQTAHTISQKKDYSVRAIKRSGDEVGVLTDAFNHMLAHIEVQNAEIRAFNQELEEKVTERTKELAEANAVLKQQHELVASILDSSLDLIAVFDRELRYLVVNHQVVQFYQKKKEDLQGRLLLEVFPQLAGSALEQNLRRALGGELVRDHHYVSRITRRRLDNFFIPLRGKDGEVDRVMLVGHDLTEIATANEKLKSVNQALEKSNRDLEQFAYVASHDLQEPLRKIQVFTELSQKNSHKPEILGRYLEKINTAARRMTDLIKAVLNYSRLSGAQETRPVDVNAVLANIRHDLELTIEEKKAVIRSERIPLVKGVPQQISQLFYNLVSNSLKFSRQQPQITLTCRMLPKEEVQASGVLNKDNDYVEIHFQDNGIGFDQQYADKVFTIFQRVHSDEQYAGTGIGLALCKKIVENHQGTIAVESKPGEGTRFVIVLPVEKV